MLQSYFPRTLDGFILVILFILHVVLFFIGAPFLVFLGIEIVFVYFAFISICRVYGDGPDYGSNLFLYVLILFLSGSFLIAFPLVTWSFYVLSGAIITFIYIKRKGEIGENAGIMLVLAAIAIAITLTAFIGYF